MTADILFWIFLVGLLFLLIIIACVQYHHSKAIQSSVDQFRSRYHQQTRDLESAREQLKDVIKTNVTLTASLRALRSAPEVSAKSPAYKIPELKEVVTTTTTTYPPAAPKKKKRIKRLKR